MQRAWPLALSLPPPKRPGGISSTTPSTGTELGAAGFVPQHRQVKGGPHGLLTPHLGPCRYSYNEEEGELPEWFTEEERQHRRRQLPVDKQTVEAYRQRWKEINARPIKKVAEAKARKKRRVSRGGLPGLP